MTYILSSYCYVDAFILSLDRLGVSLMACEGSDEWLEMRMPFDRVVTDLKEYYIGLFFFSFKISIFA